MKKQHFFVIIVSVLFLCACPNAPAQTTQVSATVLDPGGKPYQNCTGSANFVPSPTATTVPTISGSTFQTIVPIASCDSFGKFSMTLVDNNQVSDGHTGAQASQWSFFIQSANVCFVGQKVSFSTTLTITGASQDISAALTAAAASLPSCGGGGGSGPALQTNGTPNTLQTVLNLKSGNNVSLSSDGSGGVTVTTNAGTPSGSLQYDLAGIFTGASGIATSDGNSLSIKGQDPFADLAAFSRVGTFGCSTTATINLGSPSSAVVASAGCFQVGNGTNNDGITIYNAGPAVTVTTPSAPTVTPNTISAGGTALGGGNYAPNTVVNGVTGASTYSYLLIVRDALGGFAAPGTATTIATGPSTLGTFNCPITSEARSGRNITVNFTANCAGAVVGAMMFITGTAPNPPTILSGFYSIQTVNSATQVVVAGPFNSNSFGWNTQDVSGTNSSTGGTAYFINSNHLKWAAVTGAWEYYVCAERPGDVTYHRIGVTKPSTAVALDIQFDDYGSPIMDSQVYPSYITDAVCNGVTGKNDPLTTTITNIVGTTLTLANAATNAVTNATAVFDNGPGLLAAANSVAGVVGSTKGRVYIPPTVAGNGFQINSYTVLPANVVIEQAGRVFANETINIGNAGWNGGFSDACGTVQFSYYTSGSACIFPLAANPVFLISSDGVSMSNMSFFSNGNVNGGTMIVDDASHSTFNNIQFQLSGGTNIDYLAMGLVFRGDLASNDAKYSLDRAVFQSSTYTGNAPTWTPFVFFPNAQNSGSGTITNNQAVVDFKRVSSNQRGIIQEGAGVSWNIENNQRQSGVMPYFWHLNGSGTGDNIKLRSDYLDTDGTTLVSEGSNSGSPAGTPDYIDGIDINGGAGLLFGGFGPASYRVAFSGTSPQNFLPNNDGNMQPCAFSTPTPLNCNFDANSYIGPAADIFFPLPAPTSLVQTLAAGGSLASDTVKVAVSAVGADGKETIPTPTSAGIATGGGCPGAGNCEFTLTWTPPATGAAVTYNVYACYNATTPICSSGINRQATGITSASYTLTSISQTGIIPNSFTQTGQAEMNATQVISSSFVATEAIAPTCLNNYDLLFGIASGHRLSFCNNAGSVDQVVGAATTDTLTNKTLTSPVISTIVNTGTLTLPTATGTIPVTICSGQIALSTGAIDSGARGTNTLTCTGLSATTDTISCTFSGDTNAVTGYAPSASGGLSLKTWASTNTINVDQVNDTGSSITPGAATVNCKGIR